MIWNRQAETISRDELEALQLARARKTVATQLEAVPFQRDRLHGAGVESANEIQSLDDFRKLPFSSKVDLRENYPFGLLAVPREQVVRIHASSGTRGKPTVVGYTRHDLDVWSEVMARCLALGGVERGSVLHNAYGYGLFTGGLGFHMGGETIGCTVVPMSGGLTQRQVMMLQDLGGDVLGCTPSYALNISHVMAEMGVEPANLKLKVGIFGAEPWTEEMRGRIERELGIAALNIYGLSEIVGPGVSAECIEGRNGAHIQEDHFLAEIVDPETGVPLPPGQQGELVLTTLTKEALPMVRYRTGDITSLDVEPCVCGRTTARMSRIVGRHDDMLIIRGVNLYPSEVERILLTIPEVAPHYQIVLDRPDTLDVMTLLCEPAHFVEDPEALGQRIRHTLYEGTGVHPEVEILERGAVPRSEGKAVRVVDRRPK